MLARHTEIGSAIGSQIDKRAFAVIFTPQHDAGRTDWYGYHSISIFDAQKQPGAVVEIPCSPLEIERVAARILHRASLGRFFAQRVGQDVTAVRTVKIAFRV